MVRMNINSRASLLITLAVAAVVLQCSGASAQTVHVVGDSVAWTVPQGGAQVYTDWAAEKTFVVGDILLFNFMTNQHDVQEVPKASYDACTSDNAIGSLITTGPANVSLSSTGDHYYICTIGSHCLAGQKLSVTVAATGSSTPTSSTNGTSPSPTTAQVPEPDSSSPAVASSLLPYCFFAAVMSLLF